MNCSRQPETLPDSDVCAPATLCKVASALLLAFATSGCSDSSDRLTSFPEAVAAPLYEVEGTDYYFPGTDIEALRASDIPQSCFWRPWYAGNAFAYSRTVPLGSGNNPETWVTYTPAKFKLPAGATLVMQGEYPHNRYMSIDTYAGPFPLDSIAGDDIEPDAGSTNPYRIGADRSATERSFTLRLVDEAKPASPPVNTLYLGSDDPELSIFDRASELRHRSYLPDRGRDVMGDVDLPELVALELVDGTVIEEEKEICARINLNSTNGDLTETAVPLEFHNALIAMAPEPERAPAQEVPRWERFFSLPYSYVGSFLLPTFEDFRKQIPVGGAAGGGGDLAGTQANAYLFLMLSHETPERKIAVSRVKLPNTPKTFDGQETLESAGGELQAKYWSICSNVDVAGNGLTEEGFPTGVRQGMCHNDETVVLNEQRYTRIVHSLPEDRPWNAVNECGWSWLSSGKVDNLGRPVTQILLRPALDGEPDFAENSTNVTSPGMERSVMGDYLPVTEYMSREEFEALECNTDGYMQPELRPDLPAPVWGTDNTIKPAYPKFKREPGEAYDFPPAPGGFLSVFDALRELNQ